MIFINTYGATILKVAIYIYSLKMADGFVREDDGVVYLVFVSLNSFIYLELPQRVQPILTLID